MCPQMSAIEITSRPLYNERQACSLVPKRCGSRALAKYNQKHYNLGLSLRCLRLLESLSVFARSHSTAHTYGNVGFRACSCQKELFLEAMMRSTFPLSWHAYGKARGTKGMALNLSKQHNIILLRLFFLPLPRPLPLAEAPLLPVPATSNQIKQVKQAIVYYKYYIYICVCTNALMWAKSVSNGLSQPCSQCHRELQG